MTNNTQGASSQGNAPIYDGPLMSVELTMVDGKQSRCVTDTDDPVIALFGEVAFFDFGEDLVQVERVQSLKFTPFELSEDAEDEQ